MSICFMLVGLPCSGKSTFVQNMLIEQPQLGVVSMDKYIEKDALSQNLVYDDIFYNKKRMSELEKEFKSEIRQIIEDKRPFIWDQMNITQDSRKSKLARLKSSKYNVIAFEFIIPRDVWWDRIKSRTLNQSYKIFSTKFYEEIEKSFEHVDPIEPFDEVYIINESGNLIKKPKKAIANSLNTIK